MSLISKQWQIRFGQWLSAIAEQVRSVNNILQVWIRRKDVRIDHFLSDAVYIIEGGTCTLTWSVYYAYRVHLSDGLGQYTQLRYGIRVPVADLPERLILTAYGQNGAEQAELFFTHLRVDQEPIRVPVLLPQELIALRVDAFTPANPVSIPIPCSSLTPILQLKPPVLRLPAINPAVDDQQIKKLMQGIYMTEDLTD